MQGTGAAIAGDSQPKRLGACQAEDRSQASGGGVRSNLENEMELLFTEADALRQENVDRLM